jgi:hypothetical protein
MKILLPSVIAAVMLFSTSHLFAQAHSDVELGLDNLANPLKINIEEIGLTINGLKYFAADIEDIDPLTAGNQFGAEDPGFTTNAAENLRVRQNDQIWIRALNSSSVAGSVGLNGFVNYFNPTTNSLQLSASHRFAILDNTATTADLVFNGFNIESGPNPQFIQSGNATGDIHSHVTFDLLDDVNAPNGAYGIMFDLQADLALTAPGMDISSDPFWVIFNHGMTTSDFNTRALPAFGITAVPEPSTLVLVSLVAGGLVWRRRRDIFGMKK